MVATSGLRCCWKWILEVPCLRRMVISAGLEVLWKLQSLFLPIFSTSVSVGHNIFSCLSNLTDCIIIDITLSSVVTCEKLITLLYYTTGMMLVGINT